MTESEAKTKWCPFARSMSSNSPSSTSGSITLAQAAAISRNGGAAPWDCKCLASECMMWRKHGLDSNDGFCGLAGHATLDVAR